MSGEKETPLEIAINTLKANFLASAKIIINAARSAVDTVNKKKLDRDLNRIEAYNALVISDIKTAIKDIQSLHQRAKRIADIPDLSFLPDENQLSQLPTDVLDTISKDLLNNINLCKIQITSSIKEHIAQQAPDALNTSNRHYQATKTELSHLMHQQIVSQTVNVNVKNKAIVTAYIDKANALIDECIEQNEQFELSEGAENILTKLCASESASNCQEVYARLVNCINSDSKSMQREKEQKQAQQQRQAKLKKRLMVATVISHSLSKMGYKVSDTDNEFYVKDGKILAKKDEFSDHALIVKLNEDGTHLVTSPVRLTDEKTTTSDLEKRYRLEDKEFDEHWCSRNQLGQLVKDAEKAGIKMGFRKTNKMQASKDTEQMGILEKVKTTDLPQLEELDKHSKNKDKTNVRK